MIDLYKERFSELLRRIETINMDQSVNHDHMGSLFRRIEDDYRQIQGGLAAKLEDLKIISNSLDHSYSSNDGIVQLKPATDKAQHKLNNYAFFEMKERLIPFNLKKGDWLFKEGRIEEALNAWEEVLKVNPDNEYVHSRLLQIMDTTQGPKVRAEELHSKYRFKYIGSFGQNILARPFAIVAGDHGDTLFVSDNVGNKIHKFNVHGKYLGPLPVEVKKPLGLFKDDENNIWICDFGNSRLLAVDSNGNMTDEISLKEILGDSFGSTHPVFGYLSDKRLYLLLLNKSYQQRMLVSFDRYNTYNSLDIFPTDILQTPNFFRFIDNELYLCDYTQCALFVYNAKRKCVKQIGYQTISHPLRCFINLSNNLFLSAGKHILKVVLNGQSIFTANLPKILHTTQANPYSLAVLKQENIQVLFVMDGSLACIHKFAI